MEGFRRIRAKKSTLKPQFNPQITQIHTDLKQLPLIDASLEWLSNSSRQSFV